MFVRLIPRTTTTNHHCITCLAPSTESGRLRKDEAPLFMVRGWQKAKKMQIGRASRRLFEHIIDISRYSCPYRATNRSACSRFDTPNSKLRSILLVLFFNTSHWHLSAAPHIVSNEDTQSCTCHPPKSGFANSPLHVCHMDTPILKLTTTSNLLHSKNIPNHHPPHPPKNPSARHTRHGMLCTVIVKRTWDLRNVRNALALPLSSSEPLAHWFLIFCLL